MAASAEGDGVPEPGPGLEPIRTLIVDDHALFRRGLEIVLVTEPDIEVVGEASDGAEAVEKAGESLPDVVLMDIRMPRSNGIDACRAIKDVAPSARIIILTMSDEEEDLFDAIKAGASGYLLKDIPLDQVAEAVRSVHGGQSADQPVDGGQAADRVRVARQKGRRGAAAGGPRAQADRPGDAGAEAGRARDEQPGYREGAVHLRQHGQEPCAGTSWRSCRSTRGWRRSWSPCGRS